MENVQKIDQIINKAGCSYEDAKAALEGCEWDMIDAIISLERDGKVVKETVEQKTEEAAEFIPEVTAEVIPVDSDQKNGNDASGDKDGTKKRRGRGLWARFKDIMTKNRMVVIKSSGEQIIDLPIYIPLIALVAFFWATLGIAVIAMVFGCRFHFEGEDLGKTNINNTMDKATDYAEKVRSDLSGKNK